MNVAVVGGGIAGLAAAWFLRETADVTVFEAADRVGGKILTTEFGGRPVDEGADAFITRTPDGVDLARELGLGDELVAPAAGQASLWARGRLRPQGRVGIPARGRPAGSMKPQTRIIHGGDQADHVASLTTPIYETSTFVFEMWVATPTLHGRAGSWTQRTSSRRSTPPPYHCR